jgi:hypothetical protein
MDRDDIERIGLGLRFIAKLDNPLRDLEFSDFDRRNLSWRLFGLRRRDRLWLIVRRHKLRQIHAPVFEYSRRHIGHCEPNGVEYNRPDK